MARKSSGQHGKEQGAGDEWPCKRKKMPDAGIKRRKSIGKAASIVLLGGFLLSAGPAGAEDYELPFISVKQKPVQKEDEKDYFSTTAEQPAPRGNNENAVPAGSAENYFNSILLDLNAPAREIAIANCAYCNCASCACPSCSSCSSCTVCGPACTACVCVICNCDCICVKGACNCNCYCFCHCASCTVCGGGVCACYCASDCM